MHTDGEVTERHEARFQREEGVSLVDRDTFTLDDVAYHRSREAFQFFQPKQQLPIE